MEYRKLIEKHEYLKTYFTDFSHQLHQLASEGKSFVRFHRTGGILIDFCKLINYLQSNESVFKVRSILDFFESLRLLQFTRTRYMRSENSFIFFNPNFKEDQAVPDDLYNIATDIENLPSAFKRPNARCRSNLIERLLRMEKRTDAKMTKLQFARLRLKFSLQKKFDVMRYELDSIDHDLQEPEYVQNQDIAGYYGNVELSALRKVFGDYYPCYQTEEEEQEDRKKEPSSDIISNEQQVPQFSDENKVIDVGSEEIPENIQLLLKKKTLENSKEKEPPHKRPRRHCTKSITNRETNDALLNLQKEFENFD